MCYNRISVSMVCLFLCCLLSAIPELSFAPGTYNRNLLLSVKVPDSSAISYSFVKDGVYLPFNSPLHLTALKGEARSYGIYLREHTDDRSHNDYFVTYRIYRKLPEPPVFDTAPGLFEDQVLVSFLPFEGTAFLSINGSDFKIWDGDPLVLDPGSPGLGRFSIAAYVVDDSGNHSRVSRNVYYVQKLPVQTDGSFFSIPSPVPGVFGNKQLFYIINPFDLDIHYTVNGSVPSSDSPSYMVPVVIDRSGEIDLRVVAYDKSGKKVQEQRLAYTVIGTQAEVVNKNSGLYRTSFQVEPLTDKLVYTLDDSVPDSFSRDLDLPLRLSALGQSVARYPVQIARNINGQITGQVYRYYYIIDDRKPSAPMIVPHGTLPFSSDSLVSILADRGSSIYYTLDGTTPDKDSILYSGPLVIQVPDEDDSQLIRTVAYDRKNNRSDETVLVVPFSTQVPAAPDISAERIPGGYRFLVEPIFGQALLYEIAWNDESPVAVNSNSPRWPESNLILPPGMKADAYIAFAYRDEAGNLSDSVSLSLSIDNSPLSPPKIEYNDPYCDIIAHDQVRYAVFPGHLYSITDKAIDLKYAQRFELDANPGRKTDYTIAAYSVHDDGRRSTLVLKRISVDRRVPVVPDMLNISNHMIYTDSSLRLKPAPVDQGISLHYTISRDGTSPQDPTPLSPLLEHLVIETVENEKVIYHIRILPYIKTGNRSGEIRELMFVVDRKYPDLPVLSGIVDGETYNSRVNLELSGFSEHDTVFVSYTRDGSEPGNPVIFGFPYTDTIILHPVDNRREEIRVRTAVRDLAGNMVVNEQEYRFFLDASRPQKPLVEGLPEGGISNEPISLRLLSEHSVYFRLIPQNELLVSNPAEFTKYTSAIRIAGKEGELSNYLLEIQVYNDAGNSLYAPYLIPVTINRLAEIPPPAPAFFLEGSRVRVEWDPGTDVEYSFDNKSFMQYRFPFSVDISDGVVFYRRKEIEQVFQKSFPDFISMQHKVYSGVENSSRSASRVTLTPEYRSGIVRFEISTEDDPVVQPFSPIFRDPLEFDVPQGGLKTFYVGFAFYENRDSLIGYQLPSLVFTIDRKPPSPPGIRERIEGVGSEARKIVQLLGEGSIFYRIKNDQQNTAFNEYIRPFSLHSDAGPGEKFLLEAYSVNELGTKSITRSWELFIDQNVVYVSLEGDDFNDGSRQRPMRTIEHAFRTAREQGRSTVFLYPGIYSIQRPLQLSGIQLSGGFGQADGKSIIQAGEFFIEGDSMLLLSAGDGSLTNVAFDNRNARARNIIESAGNLYLSSCSFAQADTAEYYILQKSGSMILENLHIDSSAQRGMIRQTGGVARILASRLYAANNRSSDNPLLSSIGGIVHLHDVTLHPGSGRRTQAFYGVDAKLYAHSSSIHSGTGTISSSAIVAINSKIDLARSNISGSGNARILSLIDLFGGELHLERCILTGGGLNGSTLLQLSSAKATVTYSEMSAGGRRDFTFFINGEESDLELENSILRGEFEGDVSIIRLSDSRAHIIHNILDVHSRSRFSRAFDINNSRETVIANSVINNRMGTGTALQADTVASLIAQHNSFFGWLNLAIIDEQSAQGLRELNMIDADPLGGPIHGNLSEDPVDSFSNDQIRLRQGSRLINRGNPEFTAGRDIDGRIRPNPDNGVRPMPDIGVHEFYF